MKMENNSWLWPQLKTVLEQHKQTLFNWRKQVPTQQGRIKNFENWLLVELVNHIRESGLECDLRTNGHFTDGKVKASDVKGLRGSKFKAKHLSADISLCLEGDNQVVSAEIKTGLSPLEIMNDLLIVKHYNMAHVSNKAEFGWVVLIPEDDTARRSSLKTYKNIQKKIEIEYPDFTLLKSDETDSDWLFFCVAIPNAHT